MSNLIDRDQLAAGISRRLSDEYAAAAPALGALLADVLLGHLSAAEVERRLQAHPSLLAALYTLRGCSIPAGADTVVIDGADGADRITVSDAAGARHTLSVGEPTFVQQVNVSGGSVGQIIGRQIVYQQARVTITPLGARLDPAEQVSPIRLRTLPHPPRPIRAFLDRAPALAAISAELRSGGGAWVAGAPGCGLSALLRQAANDPQARGLADGVLYVDGAHEPPFLDDIVQRLFASFYTAPAAVKVDLQGARVYLEQIQALFALDRLPLGKADLTEIADMLRDGAVLIAADHEAPDTLEGVALAGLPPTDALALVSTLDPEDAAAEHNGRIAQLCWQLDCLPLPLVLAIQLLRRDSRSITTPAADPLGHLIGALAAGDVVALDRVVEVALAELRPEELSALRALLGAGGPDVALVDLCAITRLPPATVEHALDSLIELRLVSGSGGRYAPASLSVRRALARLLDTREERRHAALAFAARAASHSGDIEWAARERGNLSAAVETLAAEGNAAAAGAVAHAAQPALVLGGLWESWGALSESIERVASAGEDAPLRAWALHEQGTRAGLLGDKAFAAARLGDALAIREALGDTASAALTRHNMAYLGLLPPPPDDDAGAPADEGQGAAARPGGVVAVGVAIVALVAVVAGFLWLQQPAPLALIAAPDAGSYPLEVHLRAGQASGAGAYTYRWDFGDGSPPVETSDPEVTHVYGSVGSYTAALTTCNAQGRCAAAPATAQVVVRNEPPRPLIGSPAVGSTFAVAEPMRLLGSATDPEDGDLATERLSWRVLLSTGGGTRELPIMPDAGGPIFVVPHDIGIGPDLAAELVVELTARDSLDATAVISQTLRPATVAVELRSEPPGLTLLVDGQEVVTPYRLEAWAGAPVELTASDQADDGGMCLIFDSWSDDGAPAHMITAANLTATAVFHPLSVSLAAAAATVGEEDARVDLRVALERPAGCQVRLAYGTRDETARAGEDYKASQGALTIAPGEPGATISIPIVDDTRAEGAERFVLAIDELAGAAPGAARSTAITINDDDALPAIGFMQASLRVAEGDGSATITVALSAPAGLPITAEYAVAPGSAAAGEDYAAVGGTLTFAPDETRKSFVIPLENDRLDEDDETIALVLSALRNAAPGQTSASVIIIDDDAPPEIGFSEPAYTVPEDSGEALITVNLNAPSGRAVTVVYSSAPGSADPRSDFTIVGDTLTLAPGVISQAFRVPISADDFEEETESVQLSLADPTNATLTRAEATLFIANDDRPPQVQLAAEAYSGDEGTRVAVVVQVQPISGKAVAVSYAVRGGTASPDEYVLKSGTLSFGPGQGAQEIIVQLNDDDTDEPNESLTVVLSDPVNAALGPISAATITIIDDDVPQISLIALPSVVEEHTPDAQVFTRADNYFKLLVTLDQPSWQEVRVNVRSGAPADTATGGAEYRPRGGPDYEAVSLTLTFAPGQIAQTVWVVVFDDSVIEDDETATFTLSSPVNAAIVDGQVVVTIQSEDYTID